MRQLLGRLAFVELVPPVLARALEPVPVLARALEPFPVHVRTFDALHLASIKFLRRLGQRPMLATYDHRLTDAANALGIPIGEP